MLSFSDFATAPSSTISLTPFYEGADAEMKQNLKKLSKKDAITKLRALEELAVIMETRGVETVKEAIGHWCYMYPKLLLENDRRVRVSAHVVTGLVVSRVKKGVLPHLGGILGPWYCSMNDPSKDVAAAAKKAYDGSFPEAKRVEILSSHGGDVLSFIGRQLTSTVETISDMKVTSKEDAEERHERVLLTALLSIPVMLDTLSGDGGRSLPYEECLTNSWPLLKSPSAKIRRGVMNIIPRAVAALPYVFEANLPKYCKIIFAFLQDDNINVIGAAWQAVLVFARAFPLCWEHVNLRKVVMPILSAQLKAAFYGGGRICYSCLLPFLMTTHSAAAFSDCCIIVFQDILKGIDAPTIGDARGNLLEAYSECAAFVLNNLPTDEKEKITKVVVASLLQVTHMFFDTTNSAATSSSSPDPSVYLGVVDKVTKALVNNAVSVLLDYWAQVVTEIKVGLGEGSCNMDYVKRLVLLLERYPDRVELGEISATLLSKAFSLLNTNNESFLPLTFAANQLLLQARHLGRPITVEGEELGAIYKSIVLQWAKSAADNVLREVESLHPLPPPPTSYAPLESIASLTAAYLLTTEDERRSSELTAFITACRVDSFGRYTHDVLLLTLRALAVTLPPSSLAYVRCTALDAVICSAAHSYFNNETSRHPLAMALKLNILGQAALSSLVEEACAEITRGKEDGGGGGIMASEAEVPVSFFICKVFLAHTLNTSQPSGSITASGSTSVTSEVNRQLLMRVMQFMLQCEVRSVYHDHNEVEYTNPVISEGSSVWRGLCVPLLVKLHDVSVQIIDVTMKAILSSPGDNVEAIELWSSLLQCLMALPPSVTAHQGDIMGQIAIFDRKFWDEAWGVIASDCISSTTAPLSAAPNKDGGSAQWWSLGILSKAALELMCSVGAQAVLFRKEATSTSTSTSGGSWMLVILLQSMYLARMGETWSPELSSSISRLSQQVLFPFIKAAVRAGGHPFEEYYEAVIESLVSHSKGSPSPRLQCASSYALNWLLNALFYSDETVNPDFTSTSARYQALSPVISFASLSCLDDDSAAGVDINEFNRETLSVEKGAALLAKVITSVTGGGGAVDNADSLIPFKVCCSTLVPLLQSSDTTSYHSPLLTLRQLLVEQCALVLSLLTEESIPVPSTPLTIGLETISCLFSTHCQLADDEVAALEQLWLRLLPLLPSSSDAVKASSAQLFISTFSNPPLVTKYKSMKDLWNTAARVAFSLLYSKSSREGIVAGASLLLATHMVASSFREETASADYPLALELIWEHYIDSIVNKDGPVMHRLVPLLKLVQVGNLGREEVSTLCDQIDNYSLSISFYSFELLLSVIAGAADKTAVEDDEDDLLSKVDGRASQILPKSIFSWALHFGGLAFDLRGAERKGGAHIDAKRKMLLKWLVLLQYLPNHRQLLTLFIRAKDIVPQLLNILLPHFPAITAVPTSLLLIPSRGEMLEELVGFVFLRTAQELPLLTRYWWDQLPRSSSTLVSSFTARFITPLIMSFEIAAIQEAYKKKLWNNAEMSVSASQGTREVTATVKMEEHALEVVVKLPPDYPLRVVEVDVRRCIGVKEERWRRWILQIRTLLSSRDGIVVDAVLLWKQNIDQEFDGIEPCPICFSILHSTNRKMPQLKCNTCNTKFHNACMYKWFHTSHNRNCPMCRSTFEL